MSSTKCSTVCLKGHAKSLINMRFYLKSFSFSGIGYTSIQVRGLHLHTPYLVQKFNLIIKNGIAIV